MAFHLGSLGFLTPFKFDTYQTQVTQIIEGERKKKPLCDLFVFSCLQSTPCLSGFCKLKEVLRVFGVRRQRCHRAAQPLEGASAEGQHGEEGAGGREGHHPDQRRRGEQLEGRAVPGSSEQKPHRCVFT